MARRRSQTPRRGAEGGAGRRLPPGPILLALAVVAAIAVVVVFIVLQVASSDGGIEHIGDIPVEGRTLGDADAPVTMIEFADYQCPYCKRFAEGAERQIEEEYIKDNLVKLEFRNMAFIGTESLLAAEAAQCANDQGEFWNYHDKLFEEQRGENTGTFSPDRLKRFAGEIGLNQAEFDACLDGTEHEQTILDETNAARDAGVKSTPSFIIVVTGETSGEMVTGNKLDELRAAIDKKLEEAQQAGEAS